MSAGQSRGASAIEALANVAFGLGVAFVANLLILPAFGLPVSLAQAGGISAAFTAVSLARSYMLRRLFNWFQRAGECGPCQVCGSARPARWYFLGAAMCWVCRYPRFLAPQIILPAIDRLDPSGRGRAFFER